MKLNTKKFILFVAIVCVVSASPMIYKKNEDNNYEPELIAVSSTVVPLTLHEVVYGNQTDVNEEYRQAYLKFLRKKNRFEKQNPDKLITITNKFEVDNGK